MPCQVRLVIYVYEKTCLKWIASAYVGEASPPLCCVFIRLSTESNMSLGDQNVVITLYKRTIRVV